MKNGMKISTNFFNNKLRGYRFHSGLVHDPRTGFTKSFYVKMYPKYCFLTTAYCWNNNKLLSKKKTQHLY